MDASGNIGFHGTYHNRRIRTARLHHQNHVNMIWHDHEAVHPISGKYLRYPADCFPCDLSIGIQPSVCPENTALLVRADRNEVIIGGCIIISPNPRMLSDRKSFRILFFRSHGNHPDWSAGAVPPALRSLCSLDFKRYEIRLGLLLSNILSLISHIFGKTQN